MIPLTMFVDTVWLVTAQRWFTPLTPTAPRMHVQPITSSSIGRDRLANARRREAL